MTDVQTAPTRGRSRGRGSYRGGRAPKSASNVPTASVDPLEEDSELGKMKKLYHEQLSSLTELFPDWSHEDLVYALQESNGDLETTVEGITDGRIERFNDVVKKTRDKSRPKHSATDESDGVKSTGARSGRGRGGADGGRGGRGRGTERGRGSARGGRAGAGAGAAINGSRSAKAPSSVPTESAGWGTNTVDATAGSSWDEPTSNAWAGAETTTAGGWDDAMTANENKAPAPTETQKSSLIPQGTKKSWASMLAKPDPAPAASKKEQFTPAPGEPQPEAPAEDAKAWETAPHEPAATDWGATPTNDVAFATNELDTKLADAAPAEHSRITSATLPPPKDPLTEDNLEHLPDSSGQPSSETVASTRDPRSTLGSVQPSFNAGQPAPIARPSLGGGYATTAQKAAGHTGRSLSFQRLKEQQDAVVMPGNHAIDRTAVQFGSMSLDGESRTMDADEDRENAETRGQPPQQSPSQPRASLPPASRGPAAHAEQTAFDSLAPTKHAPGLPMPGHQQATHGPQHHHASGAPGLMQSSSDNQAYSQLGGRYGANAFGQDAGASSQKNYDPFSSQLYPQSQNDPQGMYTGLSQPPSTMSQPATSQAGGYSQSHGDYSSHYPGDSTRGGYSNYYSAYNQPSSSHQESAPQQRATSGYTTGESGHGAGHQSSQPQPRFSETQASGHNTPNPGAGSQQHHTGSQSHHNQPIHQQSHGHAGYGSQPYGGQYGHSGYYQQYSSQGYPNYYNYNQQGYGGQYGNKTGMYGGSSHHGYGMSSHGSYDNANSPATSGAFGGGSSFQGRESSMTSGVNEYARSGSAQPPSQSQHSSTPNAFGTSMADTYGGRSSSGFGSHGQGFGSTPTTTANEDSIKALHDTKTGPSSLGHTGRPGSGFNSNNQSNQGYGQPGNQQQGGFGGSGYPSQLGALHNQYGGSGYGGIGGLGQQGGASHGNQSGYGYGSGFGNNNYGGRGGWSSHQGYGNQYNQH